MTLSLVFKVVLTLIQPNQLFEVLRSGESDVREWRRFLSLKSLRGFGLYKVSISKSLKDLIFNSN